MNNPNVTQYLIVGNGRIAQHICQYLRQLSLPFVHWYRQLESQLTDVLTECTHVLLLINDDAINLFLEENKPVLSDLTRVHFSGSLVVEEAYSTHPLMGFTQQLYDKDVYQKIPFIIEKEGPPFSELLPGFPNPSFAIARANKPYYHALCVMANNFSTLLWQKLFQEFEETLDIPHQAAQLFLQQTMINLMTDHNNALSGPLERHDEQTISTHLKTLDSDPYKAVYQAFVDAYSQTV